MVIMNRLTMENRVRVVAALVEGNSIRSTVRMTGVAKNTVAKLLADLGVVCSEYQGSHLKNLPSKRIQCDEIWSFCYSKQKNVPADKKGQWGYGDVWTWTALDADSKLIVSWLVGLRDATNARVFMDDVASRLANRVQLTTDGHRPYPEAVANAFEGEVDYAQLVKIYGPEVGSSGRYSAPRCIGARVNPQSGTPDAKHVSTSYVERQNLTMRMGMRRFTRLTNGFSKKIDNHEAAIALHFMHYNFCRIHKTLRVTPAMQAGVADHVWELEELVALVDAPLEAIIGTNANKRGPYKKG
jgi:IS1 family transposase